MRPCLSLLLIAAAGLSSSPAQSPPGPQGKAQPLLEKMTVPQRTQWLSAQRATEWLQKANKPDGRFVHGFLPALRRPTADDNYLHQVEAAWALARAGTFFRDDRAAAIARQALLTLLLETTVDPKNPDLRYTAAPPQLLSRPAACGILVAAIHELPSPGKDLLDQADQMCHYLRTLLEADGSVRVDAGLKLDGAEGAEQKRYLVEHCSGPAVYGILRSHRLRPEAWKLEAVRKAAAVYGPAWRSHKNRPMLPWHTMAYAEAYLLTKEQVFAETVFAMNDWLLNMQYKDLDPRRGEWKGGFMPWQRERATATEPDVSSAEAALSLAHACRTARAAGDVQRLQRYREALEECLRFLVGLQYTDATVQHFAEWYRPAILGAFHGSRQDGTLRVDHTSRVLAAQIGYLEELSEGK